MPGFLLQDDAISARKQQFDDWADEQRRSAERAAQQVQQQAQQVAQQQSSEVAARATQFQDWVSQQTAQQQPTAPAAPAPAPVPSLPASPAVEPGAAPPALGEPPDVAGRAKQFQDWVTQQSQPATEALQGAASAITTPFTPPAREPSPAGPDQLPAAPAGGDISQFGNAELSSDEAYAACGPAAAVRFAQRFGRNPTLRESLDLAKQVGWTQQQGMAGLDSQKALMDRLEVPTKVVRGPAWDQFAAEAQTGNPVTISTSAHYFYADGYNPDTGQFHVGKSGTDLRGGKEWMTKDEIVGAAQRLGGGNVQGALFADNPTVAATSTATTKVPPSRFAPTGKTTAELSGGGAAGGMTERAQSIMSEAGQAAAAFGGDAAKAVQAVLVTEGGMNNARGDSGQSAGPLQFYGGGGQLNNFAKNLGVPLEDAKRWVEDNPVAAVRWALGTPDAPGYLGRALVDGISKGLTGADLATHIQRTGQVSVSPERAGQNFLSLFGQGQDAVRTAGGGLIEGALEAGRQVAGRAGELVSQGQQLAEQGGRGAEDAWRQLETAQSRAHAESERWLAEQRARGEEWDAQRQRRDLDWQRNLDEGMRGFGERAQGFTAPLTQGAQDLVQGGGRFFEGLGTDVRRQQQEAQALNPYMAGVAGGGFGDPGTALTAGLERAGVPSPYREIAGGGLPMVLPSGAVRGAATTAAREAIEGGAARPELVRRIADLVTQEGPDAIRSLLNAPEVQQVLRSRAGPGVAREVAEAVPELARAGVGAVDDVAEQVIGPGDVGRRVADIITSREPAQAGAMAAVRGAGALAGGITGWQTTPEEAGPVERIGRTLGGAGVGLAVPGIAEAAITRPQIRQDMLESLRRGGLAAGTPPAAPRPGVNAATAVDVTKQLMLSDPVGRAMDMVGSVVELVRQPIALSMGGQGPEAGAGLSALVRAMPEAFDNARQALQGRQVATLGQQAQDIGKSKPIFRLLAAGDTFTRTLGEYQGMASRGVRMLRDAGIELGTPQAEQYLAKHADELYREGAKSGTSSVFGSAAQGKNASALDRLMTGFSNYKQTLLNSDSLVDRSLGMLFDQQIPFTGVPSRVLQIGLERVPGITQSVGAARIARALKTGNTFAAQKALGEVATESLIQAHIAQAIREGNITGPDDPEHPGSVQVNGEWVPLRTFGVYGLPMGIMAAFAESVEKTGQEPDPDQLERVASALNASMEPLMDAVPGFSFVKMLASLGRGGLTRAASDVASDFISRYTTPAALAKAENMVDPYVRDIASRGFESLWEPSMARNPISARFLPPKIDPTTGQPMTRGVTPLGGMDKPSSAVRAELADLKRQGYALNPPTDKPTSITIRGVTVPVKEGSPEQRAMVEARGQFLAEAGQQIQTPRYQRMTPDQKAKMWSSLLDRSARVQTRAWQQTVEPERAARILATGKRVVGRVRDVEDEDQLINRQVAIANQLRRQQMARTG